MKFYNIKNEYISFLKIHDSKVQDNKNENRPYIGIVLEISGKKYYVPCASPKPKHQYMKNSKDFRKINQGIYGIINFNNMVPVVDEALILIDIDNLKDIQYQKLLRKQYRYIKYDRTQIEKIARKLRTLVITENEKLSKNDLKIKQRCCDFKLLETICDQYQEYLSHTEAAIGKE